MRPVTDPSLLEQLNSGPSLKPVSDPSILAALNSESAPGNPMGEDATPADVIRNAATGRIDRGSAEAYLKSVGMDGSAIDKFGKDQGVVRNTIGAFQQAAQGYTSNFGDEVAGAVGGAAAYGLNKVAGLVTDRPQLGFKDAINAGIKDARVGQDAVAANFPKLTAGMNVAGGIANPLMRKGPTGGNVATRIAGNAAIGGAFGAASGVGDGENTQQRMDLAKERAAVGAAFGGGASALGEAASGLYKGAKAVKGVVSVDPIAAKELASQGIDVSAATAGSDTAKEYVRGVLGNSFFGGKNVQAAAGRVDEQITKALNDSVKGVGKAQDFYEAGNLVKSSLQEATNKFKQKAAEVSSNGWKANVDPSQLADGSNILSLIPQIKDELAGLKSVQAVSGVKSQADDFIRSLVDGVNQDSKAGTFNVGALMQLRDDIGNKIADTNWADPLQGAYKRAYGAISRDLEGALGKQSPDLVGNFKDYNRFYRSGITELKALEKKFGGAKAEEQVFNAVTSATKLDTNRLGLLMDKMTPAAKQNLQASVLRRLALKGGSQNVEDLSVQTFANNYNKLAPQAKRLLTGDNAQQFDLLVRNYQRVAPLINSIPENGYKGAGKVIDAATLFGGVSGAFINPMSLVFAGLKFGSDKLLSSVMTKPQVVRAINVAAKTQTPRATQAAIKALIGVSDDQTLRAQLQKLNDAVKVVGNDAKDVLTGPDSRRGSLDLSVFGKGADNLPLDNASRMQRARDMGFDVDNPVYHGTALEISYAGRTIPTIKQFEEFKPTESARSGFLGAQRAVKSPVVFVTQSKQLAKGFANDRYYSKNSGMWSPEVMELVSNVKNTADFTKKTPEVIKMLKEAGYSVDEVKDIKTNTLWQTMDDERMVNYLKGKGYDSAKISEATAGKSFTGDSNHKSIAIFDPKNIRSVNAKFDPAQKDSSMLLAARPEATTLALATAAGGLKLGDFASSVATNTGNNPAIPEQDKWTYDRQPKTPQKSEVTSVKPDNTIKAPEAQVVTPTLVNKIIGVESGGKADAKAKTSSAVGLGQFVKDTWLSMVRKHKPELAKGKSEWAILQLRKDPELSKLMVQKYAEDNASILKSAGVAPSESAVYLAHFLGPQTAAKVLKSDPNMPVAPIVGAGVVRSNKSVLAGKKVKDVIAWAERKMSR